MEIASGKKRRRTSLCLNEWNFIKYVLHLCDATTMIHLTHSVWRRQWLCEEKKKRKIGQIIYLFIFWSLFIYFFRSLWIYLSVSSCSWGDWAKTGTLQGGQETRPEPLQEVFHRRETSTSQVWFSAGWFECALQEGGSEWIMCQCPTQSVWLCCSTRLFQNVKGLSSF